MTRGGGRLLWADAARGACAVLVVLLHVTTVHVAVLVDGPWPEAAGAHRAWVAASRLLQPVRMPLFFAVAGWLAVGALRRPRRAVLVSRAGTCAYLYGVWLLLWLLAAAAVGAATGTGAREAGLGLVQPADAPALLPAALLGSAGPWFLHALALYAAVGRLTRRLPAALVVGVAAAVAVASTAGWLPAPQGTGEVQQHAVWYLAALRCPGAVGRLVARPRPRWAALAAVLFCAAGAAWRLLEPPAVLVEPPLRLLAVVAGLLLATWGAAAAPRTAAALAGLGRRTLALYVLHPVLLLALHPVLVAVCARLAGALPAGSPSSSAAASVVALAYPVAVTALLVAGALLAHALLRHPVALRLGAGALFALPEHGAGARRAGREVSPRRGGSGTR
ncbi:hypothetical protein NUM3379_08880 [Kineococcus sp. NUM-3379]